ncbi:MAG TPA: DNA methyltransferase [Candidatus Saccharimonadales bacterium]|nr:DNA methyltransferase [Candidatus Saccharimonadales bacterium]
MTRADIQPILEAIPAARQEDARHYGVHPYFTRRPANVVRAYIERYSREGDVVLDPFGGTGVTAIEGFLIGRKVIQNDLNPFANFIARSIADTAVVSTLPLQKAFEKVRLACQDTLHEIERSDEVASKWLKRLPLPENIRLPRNSDAEFFYEMFTTGQLAGLALIKQSIDRQAKGVRDLLLLAWSASLAKLNKTFLSAKGRAESRGGSSIFSIYRYKLASQCVELPIWETFHGRYLNVLAAKEEVWKLAYFRKLRSGGKHPLNSQRDFKVLAHDAATLDEVLKPASVDYIFTDPPYGAFITYLDLSILWNHWLGFHISDDDRGRETIVGGGCELSEEHYKRSLARSIEASLRLLRPDRWFSIVFQHWDISYFSVILETASEGGAELKAAITQTGDVIWSMHKKKNSASVLAGEMILTFYKPKQARNKAVVPSRAFDGDPAVVLSEVFDACLANGVGSFTSEALFNRLIMELWHRRALGCLSLGREEFSRGLTQRGWSYNAHTHCWSRNVGDQEAHGSFTLLG